MTPRLPNLSARQLIAALERAGFELQRQKGSHATLRHPETKRITVVPWHGGDVKRPLLKAILQQAGLSEDQLRNLL